ncbi:unnamed protein product, partial [Pylaiella littoralis]
SATDDRFGADAGYGRRGLVETHVCLPLLNLVVEAEVSGFVTPWGVIVAGTLADGIHGKCCDSACLSWALSARLADEDLQPTRAWDRLGAGGGRCGYTCVAT